MITIEGSNLTVSDGYHTFEELYEHRLILFACLCNQNIELAWKSRFHNDGSSYNGWFIAGMSLPTGQITYHIPERLWDLYKIKELINAPKFDGHNSNDVLGRLINWTHLK